jgi:enoyl-CoA hydratase/carnithine racemase
LWVDSALETDDTVEAPVDYTVTDKVAVLTMRHGQVNAIDDELIDAIHDSLRRADADPQVGAIILTSGLNGVFCGGMNLKMAASGDVLALRRFVHKLYIGTLDLQYKLAKPTIAAINGPARGAGMTLAITCDMAVAAEETDIAYPEINVGLIAAIHNVHLARQIGRAKAFELLMGGNPITAREAERIGLINHVVPETQVLERALDLGRTMAAKSPTLMALARGAFVRQYDLDYRRGVEQQIEALCTAFSTDDGREGLRAFAEKRKPQWTGPEDTQ